MPSRWQRFLNELDIFAGGAFWLLCLVALIALVSDSPALLLIALGVLLLVLLF